MAVTGTPAASLRLVPLFHLLLVIFSLPGQSLTLVTAEEGAAVNPPSYEELTSSLVVNQLAILQMMQDASNASSVAAETCRQNEARQEEARAQAASLEEALRLHLERVEEAVDAGQQHSTQEVLEAISTRISTTAQDTLTRVTELRQEMRQELNTILEEVRQPGREAPPPEATEEEKPVHYATRVHNDTLPSLCRGDKVLEGSIGSLEVVNGGTYRSGLRCSWNITLPVKAPLSLAWDYIDLEEGLPGSSGLASLGLSDAGFLAAHPHLSTGLRVAVPHTLGTTGRDICEYDWVKVDDLTNGGTSVYGGKLCGSVPPSVLEILNVVLPPTKNILVSFRSDGSIQKRGFRLNYHVQTR